MRTVLIDPQNALTNDSRLSPFAGGDMYHLTSPRRLIFKQPDANAVVSEILFGEQFTVTSTNGDWTQIAMIRDGYCGWIKDAGYATSAADDIATHRVITPLARPQTLPDVKSPPCSALSMGSRLITTSTEGRFTHTNAGWIPTAHLAPINTKVDDWVGAAEQLLRLPYLWGGRSHNGLDCSALIQLGLDQAGLSVHRDSDLQYQSLGEVIAPEAGYRRGDIAFFPGHVGVMVNNTHLLHANATNMAVTIDPLEQVTEWVKDDMREGDTRPPLLGVKRLKLS